MGTRKKGLRGRRTDNFRGMIQGIKVILMCTLFASCSKGIFSGKQTSDSHTEVVSIFPKAAGSDIFLWNNGRSPKASAQEYNHSIQGFVPKTDHGYTAKIRITQGDTLLESLIMDRDIAAEQLQINRLHDIWVMTHFKDKVLDIVLSEQPRLELFVQEERMSGKGICNQWFGQLSVTPSTVTLSKIGMTRMLCSDHADLESAISQKLEGTFDYSIKGNTLIFSQLGSPVFTFKKID